MSATGTQAPPGVGWSISRQPYIGILGVLIGAIISTLSGRITTFGLADIRGAVHAGFDEGAWITTAFTVAQMVSAFPSVWLGAIFGPRRVLLIAAAVYTASSFLLPFSGSLTQALFWQVIGGLASGTFIPLTIGFILRSLPPRLIAYGIAVYGMNSELSQNIAASLEGWFTDNWSWKWIFWDSTLLTPLMMLCIWAGMPRQDVNRVLLKNADWSGLLYASAGFGLLYAGFDQGNRLDWLNSGLINGLLLSGIFLIAAFVVTELVSKQPALALGFIARGNIPVLALLLIMFRFVVLSTAYLIPQYLTAIQGYRALETGDVLLWIALPQFLLAPVIGVILRNIDGRLPLAIGFALIGTACFLAARLTRDWATGDFLPSQIIQAVGQSFGLTSLIYFASRNITPTDALNFGAMIQTTRLFGGELGNAFMQTYVRVQEQVASNLVGLHVTSGSTLLADRLHQYSLAMLPHSSSQSAASARAVGLLSQAVRAQANILSYADGFLLLGFATILCLVLMLFLRAAPAQ